MKLYICDDIFFFLFWPNSIRNILKSCSIKMFLWGSVLSAKMRFPHFYNAMLMVAQWVYALLYINRSKISYECVCDCDKSAFSNCLVPRFSLGCAYTLCPYRITTLNRAFDLTWITTFVKTVFTIITSEMLWCSSWKVVTVVVPNHNTMVVCCCAFIGAFFLLARSVATFSHNIGKSV